jgi:23S rRNA (cytosine1962-C5)-methyltransferase
MNDKTPFAATVQLHPLSIRAIQNGHPWIIKDEWTEKFPKKSLFLQGIKNIKDKSPSFLIQDHKHPKIKARLWSTQKPFPTSWDEFEVQLSKRLEISFAKRKELLAKNNRENLYLAFAEADQLPGLMIIKLNDAILIQYYSFYWERFEGKIIKFIESKFDTKLNYWKQFRSINEQRPPSFIKGPNNSKLFPIKENNFNINVDFSLPYDIGIYTDMAAIREDLSSLLPNTGRVLNLYSYTGAFTLWCYKNGYSSVTSVDLSKRYLEILKENLKINDINPVDCPLVNKNCETYLKTLLKKVARFEFIICDPPSASSDGNSTTNILKAYETTLPQMVDLIDSGYILLFMNTHKVKRNKFENHIQSILQTTGRRYSIKRNIALKGDCHRLKGFPEGDYLKGLLIEIKNL